MAVLVVGYLLAGNFGLVPSPLTPNAGGGFAPEGVPVLAAEQTPGDGGATPGPGGGGGGGGGTVPVLPTPPPASPDTTPPSVSIDAEDGETRTVGDASTVMGSASDTGTGVSIVRVSFDDGSGPLVVDAGLRCSLDRRSCEWSADPPMMIGTYEITAMAVDAVGNSATAGPVTIIFVDPVSGLNDLLDPSDEPSGPVEATVDVLLGVVNSLLG